MRINYQDGYYEGDATSKKRRLGVGKFYWNDGKVYEGEFVYDNRHGYGVQRAEDYTYVGEWRNDTLDGYGEIGYGNEKYCGFWRQGKRSGFGVQFYKSGKIYVGEWLNDRWQGKGTLFYTDDSYRVGFWTDSNMEGEAKWCLADGSWYAELWEEGKCVGRSELNTGERTLALTGEYAYFEYENGTKYYGNVFSNNEFNGYGMFVSEDESSKYVGHWSKDKADGLGVNIENGEFAKGIWHEGKMIGYGSQRNEEEKYFGFFKNGKRDGFGVLCFKNGDVYVGDFKDDHINGLGSYYDNNEKTTLSGHWRNDESNDLTTMQYGLGHTFWEKYSGVCSKDDVYTLLNAEETMAFMHNLNSDRCLCVYNDGASLCWENGLNDDNNHFDEKNGTIFYHLKDGETYIFYNNGDCYVGEAVKLSPEGKGTFRNAYGDVFIFDFKNGQPNGKGIIVYHDGSSFLGTLKEWNPDEGELITAKAGKLHVENGEIVG